MNTHVERYLKRVKGLKSEGTHTKRRSDLRNFNEWFQDSLFDEIDELDTLALEEYFIDQSNQGYASQTLESRFQSVKGFYDFLSDKLELYDRSPFEGLSRSEYVNGNSSKKSAHASIVYVTPGEVEKMAEHSPTPSLRNELLIRLLFQTGMRRGEIASVDIDDIDRENHAIEVYADKTDSIRTVYYQPSLDLLLNQWIDGGYRDSHPPSTETDALFITPEGRLVKQMYGHIIKKAAESAGIQEVLYTDASGIDRKRITPHALRHGHAVEALKSGIDVRTVQKHLGHEKLEMTMRYLQIIDDDVKEAYRQFGSGN